MCFSGFIFSGTVITAQHATAVDIFKREHFKFEEGHYYDPSGSKIEGWIKHEYFPHNVSEHPDNFILFRETKRGKEVEKRTADVTSFVVHSDSFIVVKNFKFHNWLKYREDFCKVNRVGDKVSLYEHYTLRTKYDNQGGQVEIETGYVMKIEGMNKLHCVHPGYFKRDMMSLFHLDKELCEKIDRETYQLTDIERIVDDFNQWWVDNH